jgi:peroxiredoxin
VSDPDLLQPEIDVTLAALTPPEIVVMIDAMIADLRGRAAVPGIPVGERAPAFALPSARGGTVALDDLLASGPVVLSFYRGAWCPVCNLELAALLAIHDDIRALGASLVAVNPQSPDDSLTLAERLALDFDVLSDTDQSVADAYRIRFELAGPLRDLYEQVGMGLPAQNADHSWRLPVPATFVLDRDGVVQARHVDPDYRTRMEPAAVLGALRTL